VLQTGTTTTYLYPFKWYSVASSTGSGAKFATTVPSAVMVAALALTLKREPMKLSLLREGDWAGIVTMAIGLSALQTVLEEGNKDDWFESPFIFRLAIVALVFLLAFVAIELSPAD
jgi:DHA2 family multidrug resistance protein